MLNVVLKPLALAAGLAFVALPAAATTVSLTFNGGTAGGQATINASPVGVTGTYGAYGFNMTDSSGQLGNFVAWCLDLQHYLAPVGQARSYEITNTPFGSSYGLTAVQQARVQAVFDANYAFVSSTVTNVTQAGFQVALWDALYDTDWNAGTGDFRVGAGSVRNAANDFLLAASTFSNNSVWNLTFLESNTNNQNLVTASPVPLPAGGLLLLAALGGLGLARRRKAV
jgi:hypothetical protein